tara:strand:+ start:190 stop:363 length:174 start_codon:yes stop_codon:yes gene_type:complete
MSKTELINEILSTYTKVCFNQGIDENIDYRMGLKVGAEIMFDKLQHQKILIPNKHLK